MTDHLRRKLRWLSKLVDMPSSLTMLQQKTFDYALHVDIFKLNQTNFDFINITMLYIKTLLFYFNDR